MTAYFPYPCFHPTHPIDNMNARKPRPAGPADEPQDLDDADRYRAPALDKGLDILELLSER